MDVLDVESAEQATPAVRGRARHSRPGEPRRWLRIASAVLAVAVLVLWYALSRDHPPRDPRAYPGSQSQDLPGTLHRYHLGLPDCAEGSVRYYRYAQWEADSFYLRFTGDRHCMNQFLVLNGMFLIGRRTETAGLPFDPKTTAGFGWSQDSARHYRSLHHQPVAGDVLVDVEVALYESGESTEVYLHAGIV
ncbi:hypothetical protein [Catellatospora citrea]|uniref:Uncharacterized protein n=1 Tax=Catellatospora citrea TaxID=53366 RepID=A0A8J3KFW1_9ACTN|nr:hypothetical protein [Catellatospora citrea]RKE12611.1 hypothetical protein C8E86_7553 [Catellatospora citrea]GIF96153.1 hypothetical protein Cci01nite_12470 [Catellatospora citrea]